MDSGITDGFFVYTDAAKFVSKESAKLNVYDTVTYEKAEEDRDPFYLLKADLVYEMMDNLADAANGYHAGVSFSDIGYELSSEFLPERSYQQTDGNGRAGRKAEEP